MNTIHKTIESEFPNHPITLDVTYPEDQDHALPVIVFCHGFKGFKDWGYFPLMANKFAEAGYVFLKFNFSHNGTSPEHLQDFVDLEAFGHNNFSKELSDLDTVLDYLVGEFNAQIEVDLNRIFLLGHSKGGATAIIKGYEDRMIKAVATLAPVIEIEKRYAHHELEHWKKEGVIYIENSRTNQQMPLYFQLAEDVLNNKDRFQIEELVRTYPKPLFVLHGEYDTTVPIEESAKLMNSTPNYHHVQFEGTDHTFGGKHPYDSDELPKDAAIAIDMIIKDFTSLQ